MLSRLMKSAYSKLVEPICIENGINLWKTVNRLDNIRNIDLEGRARNVNKYRWALIKDC